MTDASKNAPLSEQLAQAAQQPLTLKDRLVGLLLVVLFAGAGAAMLLRPVLVAAAGSSPGRHRTRFWLWAFELVWSRPVGVALLLLAALILWGSLTRRSTPAPTA